MLKQITLPGIPKWDIGDVILVSHGQSSDLVIVTDTIVVDNHLVPWAGVVDSTRACIKKITFRNVNNGNGTIFYISLDDNKFHYQLIETENDEFAENESNKEESPIKIDVIEV